MSIGQWIINWKGRGRKWPRPNIKGTLPACAWRWSEKPCRTCKDSPCLSIAPVARADKLYIQPKCETFRSVVSVQGLDKPVALVGMLPVQTVLGWKKTVQIGCLFMHTLILWGHNVSTVAQKNNVQIVLQASQQAHKTQFVGEVVMNHSSRVLPSVVVSIMGWPWPTRGCSATDKKKCA